MKAIFLKTSLFLSVCLISSVSWAQDTVRITSPDSRLRAELTQASTRTYLTIYRADNTQMVKTQLGLNTSIGNFTSNLVLLSATDPEIISETYENRHGKQLHVTAEANRLVAHYVNAKEQPMDIELRAYNDGIAFRYMLPNAEKQTIKFTSEATAYTIPQTAHRWLQQFVTSYEGDFPYQASGGKQGAWGYPALFEVKNTFMLITEANASRMYCSTHLDNSSSSSSYKVAYPYSWEGNSQGDVNPTWSGENWVSPWRLAIIGDLKDVVESTLVEDVSDATTMTDTDWIEPGRAAWIYWAYNHGTKDYKICCQYVDLAVKMGWEYVLFDWEWDAMTNGGKLEDAVAYAKKKGIKVLMWYNSGGPHNQVGATPRDRMLTHENRVKEFAWLKKLGVVGVKIDFFESDKQSMMAYYLDILKDAADVKMLVNFHGSTVPRGWSRTWPHLMSMEAVFGAEQYNNGDYMTGNGARINCLLPYTRNVIGPMDYTPVAFTNSQHPHTTTFAHELALSVAFESGIQHWADRPEGFYALPDEAQWHMMQVPVAWDEIRFLTGYPGKDFVVARRCGEHWCIGGLNGEKKAKTFDLSFDFLSATTPLLLTLYADGADEKTFSITHYAISPSMPTSSVGSTSARPSMSTPGVGSSSTADQLSIPCLSQGGFTMDIVPFDLSMLEPLKTAATALLKTAQANMGTKPGQYKEPLVTALAEALDQASCLSMPTPSVGSSSRPSMPTPSVGPTSAPTPSDLSEGLSAYITLADAFSALQTVGRNKQEFTKGDAIQPSGSGTNVTTKYLGAAKSFARDSKSGSKRFGAPSRWTVENYKIDCGTSGVKQGLDNYPGYSCLQLGRWEEADNQMTLADHANSRLYQRVTLPAGHYYFGAKYHSLENTNVGNHAYLFVASEVLPTTSVEAKALAWSTLRTASIGDQFYGLEFKLTEEQEVILGWQMDGRNRHTEFRCSEVRLMYSPLPQDATAISMPTPNVGSSSAAEDPSAPTPSDSSEGLYDLSGRRITTSPLHRGVYIQRQGARATKHLKSE